MGTCHGRPNSLRSEASPMLSASLFIGMVQVYANFAFSSIPVLFAADNSALIRRQTERLGFTNCYPNLTLASEFDLTEQIHMTHKEYQIKATFVHVKGHQDATNAIQNLPLLAQLNIEADKLAGLYYKKAPLSTPLAPVLPSCPAMLIINGTSITSDYKNQLLRAYVEPKYMEHLQNKFHWSTPTIRLIAWDALANSLRRIYRPCLTTKICNDLLPVASRLEKWHHQSHSQCASCGHRETSLHMYICNAPSRIKWRRQFVKALRDRLLLIKTVPGLIDVLCSCISDWFEIHLVLPQKYPPKYHSAIITQTKIGWFQIFTGHISQEWELLENQGMFL